VKPEDRSLPVKMAPPQTGTLFPISNPLIPNLFSNSSPLPAKKSTKLGAGGVMSAVEELEGWGFWEVGEEKILRCGDDLKRVPLEMCEGSTHSGIRTPMP
jgi:hypothetical protein